MTDVSGVVAEALNDERLNRRSAAVGIGSPRQANTGGRDVGDDGLGRRAWKRGRLGGAVEND